MSSDSVLILGTGALASLFAARLAATGVLVTMLGTWTKGLSVLGDKGVRVDGEDRAYHVRATNDPDLCKGMRFAIVLVKSWQTERAAHTLSACLAQDGVALTLQNGLGNDLLLASVLGKSRVALGVTTLGATLLAPGLVCLGGDGPVSIESHPRLPPLMKLLLRAGFDASIENNIQNLVWNKLIVSSAINPLTAILRVRNGELLELPTARRLMGELASETAALAKTMGLILPFPGPILTTEEVALRTAGNLSSMLQDILRGSQTEIDSINGAVVRLAEERKLQVPVNRTVWSLVKAIPLRGKIVM
jgi:2-dehydropantoate 2-reductase